MSAAPVTVVGLGADGWAGLGEAARGVLRGAEVVLGSPRQLELLDAAVSGRRVSLPTPLLPQLGATLEGLAGMRLAVLASGDPMFFGIGATLARLGVALDVLPAPSSVSLACARLGWAVQDVEVVSAVGRPLELVHPALHPGARVLVLVGSADAGDAVRELVARRGFAAEVSVLERLGAADERVGAAAGPHDRLAVLAVACGPGPLLPRTPGLPEEAFEHDGQITKRELRALALAALAPVPGQRLWDVGAGSGSVGIEWMRVHPACRALAVEPRADRAERIARNAAALGVPGLSVVQGSAPDALEGLAAPDAVFVGGGVSVPGVLEACVDALRPGGRVVAHGVTLETEAVLAGWHARLGGSLTRVAVERAQPLGGFTGWTPARAVVQWAWAR